MTASWFRSDDQHWGLASIADGAGRARRRGAAGRDGDVLADRYRGFDPAVGGRAGGDGGGAERHNRLLAGVIEEHGGAVVTSRGEGDSFFAVFPARCPRWRRPACVSFGSDERCGPGAALRVRMGLHTGEARVRGGDSVDHAPINRCARVKAAGHGGQVLVTKTTRTWWRAAGRRVRAEAAG